MKVLLAHHTGLVSGAEISTLNLARSLPADVVDVVLACPEGPLAEQARATGVPVAPIGGMDGSLRLHVVETPRGLKDLIRLGWDTASLARRTGADVVHAVSIRAGLGAAVSPLAGPPLVVSLHDCLPPGSLSRMTERIVDMRAAAFGATSTHTAAAWGDGRDGPPIHVAFPPVDLALYEPA